MKVRDRKVSGLKTAATNKAKDPSYYEKAGALGGRAVEAIKRAFSVNRDLARRAGQAKMFTAPDQRVQYVIKADDLGTPITKHNRADARVERDQLKAVNRNPHITRYTFNDDGFIIDEREIW
jgi:hypothetical protein